MIAIDLAGVVETTTLARARRRLEATTTDQEGIAVVAMGAPWKSVRPQLEAAQNRKCAYCEDYLRERTIEIDHVRPKKASLYWWLAYWVPNLVAVCRGCNNAKSSKWELAPGETKLAPRQRPTERSEQGMLVDPTIDDPSSHFTYIYAGGRWRIAARTPRGRWTINALELDRDSFGREANEFISQVMDRYANEVEAAKAAMNGPRLARALDDLVDLERPEQRWLHLIRTVTAAIVDGTYQSPAL